MNHELFTIRYLAEQRSEQLMREAARPLAACGRPSARPTRRGRRIWRLWRRWIRRRPVPQAGTEPLVTGR